MDGFGVFNQTIDSSDGFTHSSSTISFTLTNTSGSTWANVAAVLAANSEGLLAAAHIFVTVSPANAANEVLAEGFAAGVPDGGTTVSLLSFALLGVAVLRRKLRC